MVLSTLQLSLALALSPGECSFFHSSYTAHRSTDIFRYSYTYTHAALNSTTPKGFKWPCTFFFCSVCPFYLHLHSLGLDELRKGARKGAQAVVLIWAGKSGRRWGSLCLRHLFVSVSRLVCCSPVHYIHPEILSIHTHSIHTHVHNTLHTPKRSTFIPQSTTNKNDKQQFSTVTKHTTGDRMIKMT